MAPALSDFSAVVDAVAPVQVLASILGRPGKAGRPGGAQAASTLRRMRSQGQSRVLLLRELLGVVAECEADLLTVHDRMVELGDMSEGVASELYRVQRALVLLRVKARAELVSLGVSRGDA